MDNRAGEMQIFVTAVERGSFSAAGRKLRLSPSAISKLITRLEDRLGVRLLIRTTRTLQLTPEGEVYHARARAILDQIADAERQVSSGAQAVPRGRLRISASVGFGYRCLMPLVPDFMARYPEVELDLSLTDGVVDLIGERTDIALRAGPLRDSRLKARKILESPRAVVAAPAYLKRFGTPDTPDELDRHNCLRFNFARAQDEWMFRDPETGAAVSRAVSGNLFANNGQVMRELALRGLGIAYVGQFHVQPDLDDGGLVELLMSHKAHNPELIHAVFADHEHLAARIRAFVDFLVERIGPER